MSIISMINLDFAEDKRLFYRSSMEMQRRFCVTMMSFTVLAFAVMSWTRNLTHGDPGPVIYRLICAIGLVLLIALLWRARSARLFGVSGGLFVLVLEVGVLLNAANTDAPLMWILPSAVIIPICAAPLWLTPRHFVLATTAFYLAGWIWVKDVILHDDAILICLLWTAVSVSACVLIETGFHRFRWHHFVLKQRFDSVQRHLFSPPRPDSPDARQKWADIQFTSHFQPLFSLSHQRAVGYEALLRGTDSDGTRISPADIFSARDGVDLGYMDRLSQQIHIATAKDVLPSGSWMFLNVLPETFVDPLHPAFLENMAREAGLPTSSLVVELLELQRVEVDTLSAAAARYRQHGFLIAIDDFGAGHSNLDRLLRIQPDFVKLDGELIRARCRTTSQPILPHLVSLLHNVGMVVVVEGIETTEDLVLAVEANADIAQGFLLGRPDIAAKAASGSTQEVEEAFQQVHDANFERRAAFMAELAQYIRAMQESANLINSRETSLSELPILELPFFHVCYLLDGSGRPLADPCFPAHCSPTVTRFPPLANTWDMRWDNRPFFVEALASIGTPVFSQPYHSLTTGRACVALACAMPKDGRLQVLVVKLDWTSPLLPWPVFNA